MLSSRPSLNLRGQRIPRPSSRSSLVSWRCEELECMALWSSPSLAIVHNKLKEKRATLPDDVQYFSGEDIEDRWVDVSLVSPVRTRMKLSPAFYSTLGFVLSSLPCTCSQTDPSSTRYLPTSRNSR
jgi:hypothetical protein